MAKTYYAEQMFSVPEDYVPGVANLDDESEVVIISPVGTNLAEYLVLDSEDVVGIVEVAAMLLNEEQAKKIMALMRKVIRWYQE